MFKLLAINDKKLEEQAFTHRSYLNEVKEKISSNERLEFLGDSILSFVVSEHLYKTYPEYDEGILTNLRSLVVNTKSLASLAKEVNMGERLLLSKGEEDSLGRENDSLLANSVEAYIGALFLDQGIDKVKEFLTATLLPKIEVYVQNKDFKDPKSLLQEYVQSQKQQSPIYKVLNEEGPPHAKIFTIGAFVNNENIGEGIGKSKQIAEENAAKQALEKLELTQKLEKKRK